MKLIQYKAEHAISLVVREIEEPMQKLPDFKGWAKINEGPFAFSALFGDEIIACGGIRQMWEGVGEAWILLGVGVVPHRFSVTKAMKDKLDEAIGQYHRIQAHARMDFSLAHMFLCKMGFKQEGLMRKYYPDKMDAILYSMIRAEQ